MSLKLSEGPAKMHARAFAQIRSAARLSSPQVAKLCLNPRTHSPSFAKFPTYRREGLPPCSTTNLRGLSASTAMASTTRVVEHVVLLKVREGVSAEQQEAMVSGLRSLKGLQTVIELSAGKVTQVQSAAYTHALHCRYMSKEDLDTYANDPFHLDVINKCILPIVEDRLAIDWEADVDEPILGGASYGAVQIAIFKPKEDLAPSELSDIVDTLRSYKSRLPFIRQVSVGKNFCSRAKGYEWAFLAFFPSHEELANLTKSEEHVSLQEAKVLPAMEKIAVLQYHTA